MNGIIHFVNFDRSEEWVDGEPIDSVVTEGCNNPATFGRGATIFYKNGNSRILNKVLYVEIITIPHETRIEVEKNEDKPIPGVLNLPIGETPLSTRTCAALINNGINLVRDIVPLPRKAVKNMEGVGFRAMKEIETYLKSNNLYLGMEV